MNQNYLYLVESPAKEQDFPAGKLLHISGWLASKQPIESITLHTKDQDIVSELCVRKDVKKTHRARFSHSSGFNCMLDTSFLAGEKHLHIELQFYTSDNTLFGTEVYQLELAKNIHDAAHYVKSRCLSFIKPLASYNKLMQQNAFMVQGWAASEIPIKQVTLSVGAEQFEVSAQNDNVRDDAHQAHFNLPDRFIHMIRFKQEIATHNCSQHKPIDIKLRILDEKDTIIGRDRQLIREKNTLIAPPRAHLNRSSTHDYLLVFHHLEKTAGTTIRHIISRQYEEKEIYYIYNGEKKFRSFEDFKLLSNDQVNSINIILGHNVRNLGSRITRPIRSATFLRNPIDRLLSLFAFASRHQNTILNQVIHKHNLDFVGFITKIHNLSGIKYTGADNSLVRKISGIDAKFGECNDEMLQTAIEKIENDFAVVGLVERFDESLILMRRAFGWRTPFYTKSNVSKNRKSRKELSDEAFKQIEPFVKYDLKFYQHAEKLLEKKIQQAGVSFQKEMSEFNKVNNFSTDWL